MPFAHLAFETTHSTHIHALPNVEKYLASTVTGFHKACFGFG